MSDMPEKVSYSYRTIVINKTKRDDTKIFGEFDNASLTMNIADDCPVNEQANTFLHEYFHLAVATHKPLEGVEKEDDVEERVVRLLANAVSELVKFNPEAAQWMIEGMKQ